MRTKTGALLRRFLLAVVECVLVTGAVAVLSPVHAAEEGAEAAKAGWGNDWKGWRAGTDVANIASLQRGARDFAN
jgi:hypothetical protein